MSENNLTFSFGGEEKDCKFPNNFNQLKNYFKSVFGLENVDKYIFFYEDKNKNEIQIIEM